MSYSLLPLKRKSAESENIKSDLTLTLTTPEDLKWEHNLVSICNVALPLLNPTSQLTYASNYLKKGSPPVVVIKRLSLFLIMRVHSRAVPIIQICQKLCAALPRQTYPLTFNIPVRAALPHWYTFIAELISICGAQNAFDSQEKEVLLASLLSAGQESIAFAFFMTMFEPSKIPFSEPIKKGLIRKILEPSSTRVFSQPLIGCVKRGAFQAQRSVGTELMDFIQLALSVVESIPNKRQALIALQKNCLNMQDYPEIGDALLKECKEHPNALGILFASVWTLKKKEWDLLEKCIERNIGNTDFVQQLLVMIFFMKQELINFTALNTMLITGLRKSITTPDYTQALQYLEVINRFWESINSPNIACTGPAARVMELLVTLPGHTEEPWCVEAIPWSMRWTNALLDQFKWTYEQQFLPEALEQLVVYLVQTIEELYCASIYRKLVFFRFRDNAIEQLKLHDPINWNTYYEQKFNNGNTTFTFVFT